MQPSFLPRLDSATETTPEVEGDLLTIPEIAGPQKSGDGFRVILYNDDHTPIDVVVKQLIKATKCTLLKATKITLEAHHKGRAVCFRGAREKCHEVAGVLREIRLQCEVDCD